MNKAELIDRLAKHTALSKNRSEEIINATLEIISKAVSQGQEVKLVGFGTFSRLKKKERVGRNPKTGQTVSIPATVVPRFKPGKEFKERMR